MRGGQLDRRIIVQRKASSQTPTGDPVETWAPIGGIRWALKMPVAGDERYSTAQLAGREQVEFRIRWSQDIADLQPADRIIEPPPPSDPPPTRSIYEVIAVFEQGRQEALRVLAVRRADVLP